jgi:hypothetical protein
VNVVRIDTEHAAQVARTWATWGDELDRTRLDGQRLADRLHLDHDAGWAAWRMAEAASGLWAVSGLLRLVADQAEAADAGVPAPLSDGDAVALWRRASGADATARSCSIGGSFSGPDGERGDTAAGELRSPYDIVADDPVTAGRLLLTRALADTGSTARIRADEFELVLLSDGRYLVVLPGVIDLSQPHRGLDPDSHSVRDLDRHALPSSRSVDVADNAYAKMVWSALIERGVAPGSELVIVGHSFGADTALDLAADQRFNSGRLDGSGGFDVTHVVASGYHSGPQLAHVPSSTRVLVLQNDRDAAVAAEAVGEAHVTDWAQSLGDVAEGVLTLDPGQAAVGVVESTWHRIGAELAAVSHVAGRVDDVLADGPHRVWRLEPGVDTSRASQVVAVFEGGGDGAGHHQSNYIDFLETTTDPAVTAFLGSLAGGVAVIGTTTAVDVSVAERRRRRRERSDDS